MANDTQTEWKGRQPRSGPAEFLLWGLVLLTVAGSLACKESPQSAISPGKDSQAPRIKAVLHLEPFVVNLADPEENRFLRVGIDLGLETPLSAKGGKAGDGEVPSAHIRDCLLVVLTTWHSDALLAPEGKQKLKDEIVHALRERVPELGVKEVYFTDFLVQR
jgi:flagellar FliL protein